MTVREQVNVLGKSRETGDFDLSWLKITLINDKARCQTTRKGEG